jgi:hypothetical protein
MTQTDRKTSVARLAGFAKEERDAADFGNGGLGSPVTIPEAKTRRTPPPFHEIR